MPSVHHKNHSPAARLHRGQCSAGIVVQYIDKGLAQSVVKGTLIVTTRGSCLSYLSMAKKVINANQQCKQAETIYATKHYARVFERPNHLL
jgi:hypothetical protein